MRDTLHGDVEEDVRFISMRIVLVHAIWNTGQSVILRGCYLSLFPDVVSIFGGRGQK